MQDNSMKEFKIVQSHVQKYGQFVPFNQDFYPKIETAFKQIIEPLYSDQSIALKKLRKGVDRNCEILLIDNLPVGFIIYKTSLQSEYGLKDAFELKTLLLFENSNVGLGLGKFMFKRAEALANNLHAKCMYATVSENLESLVNYMKRDKWYVLQKRKSSDNGVPVVVMVKELMNDR